MKKILLIEDNAQIRQTIRDFLDAKGYFVVEIDNGTTAVQAFFDELPDLVLLDLNLPGKDGVDICREIRAKSLTPIIMITARREEADQLQGLDEGADDYIVKPFSPKVLVVKVEKLLERPLAEKPQIVRFLDLEINSASRQLKRILPNKQYEVIHLTPAEFNLLETLALNKHKAYSRDELIDCVSDDPLGADIFDRTIDSHIKNLRQKLGTKDYIQTVRGIGYQAAEE